MRVHSSYLLGTQTIHIEAPSLPGDSASEIKLSMGKACVLVSVALQPSHMQVPALSRLAVNFSSAPGARTCSDGRREASTAGADQGLTELIRHVVNAVVPEDFALRMRVMVRVLSDDPDIPIDVPVLQALGAALHLLKVLRAPLATAVRAACVGSRLMLMPSNAQRLASDLDFLAIFTRAGLILLKAQAQDVPHALLIGAVDQVQARLLPVYETVEAMVGNPACVTVDARGISVAPDEPEQVASSVAKAVQAASRFSAVSARRMALRAISTHRATRLQALGQRFESSQIDRALQRIERSSVRQRLLAGGVRFDGRSASEPGLMELRLQPQVNGRRSVLIHSGRSETCITAAPNVLIGRSDGDANGVFLLKDVFLRFNPLSFAQSEDQLSSEAKHGLTGEKNDFFQFLSLALEPVMQPRVRVAAYAMPSLHDGIATPASAMTGVGGGCLAMIIAGAPIKAWVAGADLGLMVQGKEFVVLADPLLTEDLLLDANLKLAGTYHGLTAVQMVANTPGIPLRLLEAALAQGVDLRRCRLAEMRAALSAMPCKTQQSAPYILSMHIDPALTHEVMVRQRDALMEMCEACCASIHVDAHGLVTMEAPDSERLGLACRQFKKLVRNAQESSDSVEAVVVEVIEFFGVRLAMKNGQVALLHASRMTPATLNQGLDVGDTITIRLLGQDVLGAYRAEMLTQATPCPGKPSTLF